MNWVGGSRNRLVMRNDAKKQREFFERRRMQQRLKNLGVSPLASTPKDTCTGSTDLMTLFIVNQIATKKANHDPPKVAVLGSSSGRSKRRRNEPLVLPMSPCSPSTLNLIESQTQSQFSVQGLRKRKNVIQKQFKCGQLSPVQESAFSDNSASDYLPAITDPPTPTLSSVSSGQGMFHFQMNVQNLSQTQMQTLPPPWETSVLQQTKFQPFSQPRPMTDAVTWSSKSNSPVFQLQNPTTAQTFFGSTEPGSCGLSSKTQARSCGGDAASFFLKQPQDLEPLLDFTFNPSENGVFREFGDEEGEREDCNFRNRKSKIYLRDETSLRSSTPQTAPDPQSTGLELCKYTDINLSPTCLQQNAGPVSGCEPSPSCSCSAGYLSSDSHDDEEQYWQPCQEASDVDQPRCSDDINSNSQWNHQPGPHTPQIISTRNPRNNQNVLESIANRYKAPARQSQESSSSGPGTENSELCKCRNVSTETEEAATQTDHIWTPETCDASTQYSFVSDSETRTSRLSSNQPNADISEQPPATEMQTDAEPKTSSKNSRSEVKQMLWSKKKSKTGSLSGSSSAHKFNANNGTKVLLQRPTNPFVDFMSMRAKEKETRQDEQSGLMKEAPHEVEEVTFDNRTSGVSEDDKLLQEISDILLLLKQRKKEE